MEKLIIPNAIDLLDPDIFCWEERLKINKDIDFNGKNHYNVILSYFNLTQIYYNKEDKFNSYKLYIKCLSYIEKNRLYLYYSQICLSFIEKFNSLLDTHVDILFKGIKYSYNSCQYDECISIIIKFSNIFIKIDTKICLNFLKEGIDLCNKYNIEKNNILIELGNVYFHEKKYNLSLDIYSRIKKSYVENKIVLSNENLKNINSRIIDLESKKKL